MTTTNKTKKTRNVNKKAANKKVTSKKVTKHSDSKVTTTKVTKQKEYVRGSLIKAIYEHFDKVGFDNIKYEDCLKLAKSLKPDTRYNKNHHAWYKNKYKLLRDIA